LSTYMKLLLGAGLHLTHFDEPRAMGGEGTRPRPIIARLMLSSWSGGRAEAQARQRPVSIQRSSGFIGVIQMSPAKT
jgi:hypothetical protein